MITNPESLQRPTLRTFFIKLVSIFAAVFLFFVASFEYARYQLEASPIFKGGSQFWSSIENGLHKFANSKDIPEEKKAKIIASLRAISAKYGPLIEAMDPGAKK
ncbi:MAG: hypothetical protein CFE29_17875 [Bradyrhizobiaceae bacterium PARB1]|jgi:hypothetical protein|nr:MAG: hypothetical protein CFE29_17875 [Bradyrhizobiaceae bacterium PARB1]